MARGHKRSKGQITAVEIACYAYCPEQWRLQYGLGIEPENQNMLVAGTRHHRRKAAGERIAGLAVTGGWLLVLTAAVLLWWVWR